MMIIYVAVVAALIWGFADKFALLLIFADETEIIADTALFLHFNVSFFPLLVMLSILRYSIQGAGYTKLAMFSGVSEMIARVLVSVIIVPLWGFVGVCVGDPTAWLFANLFFDTRIYLCISPFARHCSQRTLVLHRHPFPDSRGISFQKNTSRRYLQSITAMRCFLCMARTICAATVFGDMSMG